MTFVSIDSDKCTRDGLCAAACPLGLFTLTQNDATPKPIPEAEELCITCGHCVAVCPQGALSLAAMSPDDCAPIVADYRLNPEQAEHFLRHRRSIRRYRDEAVPRETLKKLIEIARYAPSGHNLQPVHWAVYEKSSDVRALAEIVVDWMRGLIADDRPQARQWHMDRVVHAWERGEDRIFRGAPHLILAHGDANLQPAHAASILALCYLELAAPPLGLGSCWAGYFMACTANDPRMRERLDLPEGSQLYGAMMVGYPKFGYARMPARREPPIGWK